jgi:hypothetical protein
MTCDNVTQTWKTEGECQEYGIYIINALIENH